MLSRVKMLSEGPLLVSVGSKFKISCSWLLPVFPFSPVPSVSNLGFPPSILAVVKWSALADQQSGSDRKRCHNNTHPYQICLLENGR